jgi:predicted Fe-S protein YdhL (DUF1289 family)
MPPASKEGLYLNVEFIPSPCIDICELDVEGICKGCLRSADEVGQWLVATVEEKRLIMANIDKRRDTPDLQ